MTTVAPLISAAVFNWHLRPVSSGRLLEDYDIESVRSASGELPDRIDLRTVVIFCVHKRMRNLPLAIKISPVRNAERRDTFVREQQIHYLLTQIDSAAVRRAATSDVDNAELFRARGIEYAQQITDSLIANNNNFSIIPLYDYSIHPEPFNVGLVPGHQLLQAVQWPADSDYSFLVERRFRALMHELISAETLLVRNTEMLYHTISEVCCILHLLLPIRFTHGDIHLGNLGAEPGLGRPRHFRIADNIVIRVPPDTPRAVLIDFDNSSALMTDATGAVFDMRPSQASLDRRFAGHVRLTPEQTFSPLVDVFRLVESAMFLLATRIFELQTITDGFVEAPVRREFGRVCLAALLRLPAGPAVASDEYTRLMRFATTLASEGIASFDDIRTAAGQIMQAPGKPQQSLWWLLYASTPTDIHETISYLMPWDVLRLYTRFSEPDTDSVDFTLYCITGPGRVYRPHRQRPRSDEDIRIDPLRRLLATNK